MKPRISMREALSRPDLFGPLIGGDSWAAWRVLLVALVGEELTEAERLVFRNLTGGREVEPGKMVESAWLAIGRRGGKSRAISILAAWLSACCEHPAIVAGETGVLPILSASVTQSRIVFEYVIGTFEASPMLRGEVVSVTADTIVLRNGIEIQIRAASFRTIRGVSAIAAICDEIATWRTAEDSSNPDREVLRALKPSLLTTNGPLICISSPYSKMGELWEAYRRDFGPDGDPLILVAQAASRVMNPTLSQEKLDREYEKDPESAAAEFGAVFRSDIGAFVSREAIEAAVSVGVTVRPPLASASYFAGIDPSGGSSDSMTMAIGHSEGDRLILDCLVEKKPPFSPDETVREFAATLKCFRIETVVADRYGAEWVKERFAAHGITCQPAEKTASEAYLAFLPLLNSGRVDLLDDARMINQFLSLERRTSRVGRDTVSHPRGAHDDVANSAALCLTVASGDSEPAILTWIKGEVAALREGRHPLYVRDRKDEPMVRVRAPRDVSTLYRRDGTLMTIPDNRIVEIGEMDARSLEASGRRWERVKFEEGISA